MLEELDKPAPKKEYNILLFGYPNNKSINKGDSIEDMLIEFMKNFGEIKDIKRETRESKGLRITFLNKDDMETALEYNGNQMEYGNILFRLGIVKEEQKFHNNCLNKSEMYNLEPYSGNTFIGKLLYHIFN